MDSYKCSSFKIDASTTIQLWTANITSMVFKEIRINYKTDIWKKSDEKNHRRGAIKNKNSKVWSMLFQMTRILIYKKKKKFVWIIY